MFLGNNRSKLETIKFGLKYNTANSSSSSSRNSICTGTGTDTDTVPYTGTAVVTSDVVTRTDSVFDSIRKRNRK